MTATAPQAKDRDVRLQKAHAGIVTRFGAFLVDIVTIAALFAAAGQILEYLVSSFRGDDFALSDHETLTRVAYVLWVFIYCAYPLAVAGRTFGLAALGLRVTRKSGRELDWSHAVVRVLVFPLSFVLFGFGFLLILLRRDRRALHDLIADTEVIYDWDARASRLRFLAHQTDA